MMRYQFLPLLKETHHTEPMIIAGPCSAESRSQMLETARALNEAGVEIFRAGIWKPRTRPGGFEGMGAPALEWLAEVKAETGMLTATEIGNAHHAEQALEAGVDILWIGARTTASPFAMQDIADTLAGSDVTVLVKNPVCADLDLWIGGIERLYMRGLRRLGAIHRGFKIYGESLYRNTPLWEMAAGLRNAMPGLPMICDPSHIGGRRDLVGPLAERALESGYDGLMIESHCNPAEALTDASQQLTPEALARMLSKLHVSLADTTMI